MSIIEVHGVSFANKGAELMLHAIQQRLTGPGKSMELTVGFRLGTFNQRQSLGLRHLMLLARDENVLPNRILQLAGKLTPGAIRKQFGLAFRDEVNVVLDASGFAYSDQWGTKNAALMAAWTEQLSRRDIPLILLPQAFGPFEGDIIKGHMRKILDYASLVYARDEISHGYLRQLGDFPSVRQAPDFTNLVEAGKTPLDGIPKNALIVVPNERMLDKTSMDTSRSYVGNLARLINNSEMMGMVAVLLVHDEKADLPLARRVVEEAGRGEVIFLHERDSLRLKAILGSARIVVGSRYHALVSALSSGVPAFALGWSHKYDELMRDYGMPALAKEGVTDEFIEAVSGYGDADSFSKLKEEVRLKGEVQRERSETMWREVEAVIQSC